MCQFDQNHDMFRCLKTFGAFRYARFKVSNMIADKNCVLFATLIFVCDWRDMIIKQTMSILHLQGLVLQAFTLLSSMNKKVQGLALIMKYAQTFKTSCFISFTIQE